MVCVQTEITPEKFEKLEKIADQAWPGTSALMWLQNRTSKIRTADDLALIGHLWNQANMGLGTPQEPQT